MCSADVGLITYHWVKGFEKPHPDFNTWHRCRNFDKLLKWNYDYGLDRRANPVMRFEDTVDLVEAP